VKGLFGIYFKFRITSKIPIVLIKIQLCNFALRLQNLAITFHIFFWYVLHICISTSTGLPAIHFYDICLSFHLNLLYISSILEPADTALRAHFAPIFPTPDSVRLHRSLDTCYIGNIYTTKIVDCCKSDSLLAIAVIKPLPSHYWTIYTIYIKFSCHMLLIN